MDKNKLVLCLNCMSPLAGEDEKCSACGELAVGQNEEKYLPTGYRLRERFLLGRVINFSGESVSYIGYDLFESRRVVIREFAPMSLARRNNETKQLIPLLGCEVKFKALRSDYQELSMEIFEAEMESTVPIISIFEENNTVYIVYKYMNLVPLRQYLQDRSGNIPWTEAKKLMMPLVSTLSVLHEIGIIHRGISPETVMIDENNNAYLTNFMLSSSRSMGGELPCELFDGYSAPEQYVMDGWQDKATDIYSICALIYKAVTGETPIDARAIAEGQIQPTASDMMFRIPDYISEALCRGMQTDIKLRVQSASELIRLLLQEECSDTAVFTRQIPALNQKNIKKLVEERNVVAEDIQDRTRHIETTDDKKKTSLRCVIRLSVLVLLIVFGSLMGIYIATKNVEENKLMVETSFPETKQIPNFVGEKYLMLTADDKISQYYSFSIIEVMSDKVPKGNVISQYPENGTPMMEGRKVLLTVSKGSDKMDMPDFVDMDIYEAVRIIALMGGTPEFSFVEDTDDEEFERDIVLKTEPQEGTKINPKTQKIILYLSENSDFMEEIDETE